MKIRRNPLLRILHLIHIFFIDEFGTNNLFTPSVENVAENMEAAKFVKFNKEIHGDKIKSKIQFLQRI